MRISDWSSDVCSSDLFGEIDPDILKRNFEINTMALLHLARLTTPAMVAAGKGALIVTGNTSALRGKASFAGFAPTRSEEHTSELQSLMRISYAVFCLKKKKHTFKSHKTDINIIHDSNHTTS